ncbi:MAG: AarF/ABC1/UbiB kinase family protein [Myxococcales bacterium]|nr:AarF/ABC1/UbiB kinase family protein [Myxococcales bacterium]
MRKVGHWFATLARAVEIWLVALLCVIAYGVGSLRRMTILDRSRRRDHRARQRGRLLRWSFTRLGATFVKIGQVMSARADLMSPSVIAELRWLQDRVPPFAFSEVRTIVRHELGASIEERFREFTPVPIAAGSVAQVHRAVLETGEEVAVKILRPGVVERIRRDGRLLLWAAHLVQAVSVRARKADMVGHARSLIAGILAQTDLQHERDNYEQFRLNFAGFVGLRFPTVYAQHSTRAILTMEFVHGTRLEDAAHAQLPNVASVIRAAFFAMCFDHGFVHADLHPGNVLIEADGGVVLIDVGLVKRLPPGLLEQLVDLTRCIAAGNIEDLVRHLRTYHRYLADTDWDAVAADAGALIASLRSRAIVDLELGVVVGRLFALARKHGIRPMPEMTLVLLGMITNEGMAKHLDPTTDTLAVLARYMMMRHSSEVAASPHGRLARGSRLLRPILDGMQTPPHPLTRLVIGRPPRRARPTPPPHHSTSTRINVVRSRSSRPVPGFRRR